MSTASSGRAAGCMLALRLHELLPHERIVIFERSGAPLTKVRATGGGRCNVTNTFADVAETADVYPRGARLMSRLLRATPPERLMALWESLGVALRVEAEGRVFPRFAAIGHRGRCAALGLAAQRCGVAHAQ